ncbi:hypothetical protein FHS83_003103 [Rhizomicrobium palustre]|uniref:Flagellar protein FliL n=1 Tax=Rhizomicrobium palustre TaxID=189966 RepID=A0A846N2S3_9PROT|nr:hypothetical protein [Rhizomicrobium palustre]NIK89785.1 hypothetical protein [Rhizomicrobium palustre]
MRALLSPFLAFALLVSAVLAWPALASGEKEEGGAKAKKPEPGTTVEMPYLVAPMSLDGKLLGYSYISSKVVCSSTDAAIVVREKLAFLQDANVREVNARAISLASDPKAVDKDLLAQRLTTNAKRIAGDKRIVTVIFTEIKYAPLHPSDSTDGGVPPPEQAPAGKAGAETKPGAEGAAAKSGADAKTAPKDTAVQKGDTKKSRPK